MNGGGGTCCGVFLFGAHSTSNPHKILECWEMFTKVKVFRYFGTGQVIWQDLATVCTGELETFQLTQTPLRCRIGLLQSERLPWTLFSANSKCHKIQQNIANTTIRHKTTCSNADPSHPSRASYTWRVSAA